MLALTGQTPALQMLSYCRHPKKKLNAERGTTDWMLSLLSLQRYKSSKTRKATIRGRVTTVNARCAQHWAATAHFFSGVIV